MSSSGSFPKVTTVGGKEYVLKQAELDYMKTIEQQNIERVKKLQQIKSRNRITASLIGLGVISIYAYSIFAIKQENFLDDFEEPKKIQK